MEVSRGMKFNPKSEVNQRLIDLVTKHLADPNEKYKRMYYKMLDSAQRREKKKYKLV